MRDKPRLGTCVAGVVAGCVLLSGCSSSSPTSPASPVVPPAYPAPDPATCSQEAPAPTPNPPWSSEWKALGVDPPPPQDLVQRAPVTVPTILNQTGGAVDDATAERWAVALQSSLTILKWLRQHLNVGFYTHPQTPLALNSAAYPTIADTNTRLRQQGEVFDCFDPSTRYLSARLVKATRAGQPAPELVFLLTQQLGFKDTYIDTQGRPSPAYGSLFGGPPLPRTRLLAGRLVTDPALGDTWQVSFDGLCGRTGDPSDPCRVFTVLPPG